jgi:hypothetical protein
VEDLARKGHVAGEAFRSQGQGDRVELDRYALVVSQLEP